MSQSQFVCRMSGLIIIISFRTLCMIKSPAVFVFTITQHSTIGSHAHTTYSEIYYSNTEFHARLLYQLRSIQGATHASKQKINSVQELFMAFLNQISYCAFCIIFNVSFSHSCFITRCCCCGRKVEQHPAKVSETGGKWKVDKHTELEPATCFGRVDFQGFGQDASKDAPVTVYFLCPK